MSLELFSICCPPRLSRKRRKAPKQATFSNYMGRAVDAWSHNILIANIIL